MSVIPSTVVTLGGSRLDHGQFAATYREIYKIADAVALLGLSQAHALLHNLRDLINPQGHWQHQRHDERAISCNDDPEFGIGECKINDTAYLPEYYQAGSQQKLSGTKVKLTALLLQDMSGNFRIEQTASRIGQTYRTLGGELTADIKSAEFAFNLRQVESPLELVAIRGNQQGKRLRHLLLHHCN